MDIILLLLVDHINAERNLLGQLNHPFIVNMRGSFKDTRFVYIVMEVVNGGNVTIIIVDCHRPS